MMGFLQERAALAGKANSATLGPAHLFFGCRNSKEDFIYQEEMQSYTDSGVLTGLHVAFSRESSLKVSYRYSSASLLALEVALVAEWLVTRLFHSHMLFAPPLLVRDAWCLLAQDLKHTTPIHSVDLPLHAPWCFKLVPSMIQSQATADEDILSQ